MPSSSRVHRRGVVLGGLGLLGLLATGCDATDTTATPPNGSVTATGGPSAADRDVVDGARHALAGVAVNATAIGRALPARRAEATALARLARAHGHRLGGLPHAAALPWRKRDQDAADTWLHANRGRLQQRLLDASLRAESGSLAQLLASMAAAVAQLEALAR